ncbi:hypothetical protein A5775_07530 [Mycobacterium sp. 852002-10029_SCH5224772]|nr:hypothetical protein A5775_07530 [Mycobacterium sp. 852002-10029_SCH5224772]
MLAQKQAVDLKQAADYLGICVKSVRRRIADGDLPAFKIRGTRSIRVYLHDLDAMKQPVGGGAV